MRLRFVSTQTLKGLWSNRAMALSVVLVTFVSLIFIGAASLLHKQVGQVRDQWLAKLEIAVYMCPRESNAERCADGEATQKQIDAMDRELKRLRAQLDEVTKFEERLHHLADQMIEIDLDDGFKVSYAKFSDVMAKVK